MSWREIGVSVMNSPRDRILARLRSARTMAPGQQPSSAPAAAPGWSREERIARFTRRMQAVRAEIHRADDGQWAQTLRRLCGQKQIGTLLYGPRGPHAQQLRTALVDGPPRLVPYEARIEQWKTRLFFDMDAAVTSCAGAIAETGSLILWPTAEEPRLMSLVPPVHFVVLHEQNIHSTFAEAVTALAWRERMPTNALLISGPSKSADIEQTMAYGVHGPKELIVLLAP